MSGADYSIGSAREMNKSVPHTMPEHPEIILLNARVYGPDINETAVAIANGVIMATGTDAEIMRMAVARTEAIDCLGRTLIPGIVDEHLHMFAMASERTAVDCRPAAAPTIEAVTEALKAGATRSDGWIRGHGYDDSPVGLGRHLSRRDLDAVSRDRPVRVDHRSGHATVLNSTGLAKAGITRDRDDPPGGIIVRDAAGEPTGLLLDMEGWLRRRIGTYAEAEEFSSAVKDVAQDLLQYGITGITDAGPHNGLKRWQEFQAFAAEGMSPLRVTMMAGVSALDELLDAGLHYGAACEREFLRLGHAKILLTVSSGSLHPDFDSLSDIIRRAHGAGFPVAIHAVEREAVVASALALTADPAPAGNDRIEHCAECPPDVAELVADSGAKVVPNTGFLHYDGERYIQTVPEDLLPHLYPAGALDALGVCVALGSDAPVVEANPWAAMAAAAERRTAAGSLLGGIGLPTLAVAMRKHTAGNRVAAGHPADLALVEPSPFESPLRYLPEARSVLTVVAGRVVWRKGI